MTQVVDFKRRYWAPPLFLSKKLIVLLLAGSGIVAVSAQAQDLPPIRESQAIHGAGYNSHGDAMTLTGRVARMEELLEGPMLVDMLMHIEALQKDVQELRGQNEVYAHEVQGMKKRQRDLYLDIDRRLRQVIMMTVDTGLSQGALPSDGGAGSGPGHSSLPSATSAVSRLRGGASLTNTKAISNGSSNINPQAEQAAYSEAFKVLKEGRYEDSIKAFGQFFKQYPDGQYADNAIYWMGEANYVLRRFPAAIERFNRVLKQYPDSPKLADAMLKIGFSHYELRAWGRARAVLEDLGKRYPTSTAAQLAKNRLHKMKVDGK